MNLYSVVEFPPLEACIKSPLRVLSNNANTPFNTPSEALNSSLNPSAHVFTPRPSINISDCFGASTPDTLSLANTEMCSVASIGGSRDMAPPEKSPQNSSKRKFNKSRLFVWVEPKASSGKPLSGKRKLSMTSIANSTVSSIDTSISDTIENESDPNVLARREKKYQVWKKHGSV